MKTDLIIYSLKHLSTSARKVAEAIVTICKLLILRVCFPFGAVARSGKPIENLKNWDTFLI